MDHNKYRIIELMRYSLLVNFRPVYALLVNLLHRNSHPKKGGCSFSKMVRFESA